MICPRSESFFASYRKRFERAMEGSPIEALSWRLACVAPGRDIRIPPKSWKKDVQETRALRGQRDVFFDSAGSKSCDVYDRYAFIPGDSFTGPALVEERELTCCIGPGARVVVDSFLNLVIDLPDEGYAH